MRGRTVILSATLAIVIAIAAAAGWVLTGPGDRPFPSSKQQASGTVPAVEIGGPFELVSHTGNRVTDRDFHGDFMLTFFGYTYCPDVCPTKLAEIATVLDRLGENAERIQPVFISVDPERDTPEALAGYVTQFHPRIIGLTGSPEEIDSVARAYRAFHRKVSSDAYYGKSGASTQPVDDDNYLVDHSAYVYLMGPDGNYLTMFSHRDSPEKMATAITQHLEQAT